MKKKALKKDFRMEIRKSLNRFLSIFFIVAMGVAFFSGIQASAPDMRMTADYYYDSSSLMDIRVISTLGLTDDDVEKLGAVDGVERVVGCYSEDVYCGEGEIREVLHVESLADGMNELTPEKGTLPSKAGECFLDAAYAHEMGYEVGDTLEVVVNSEEDTLLKRTKFTVCGYGHSPCYISFERGSSTLGTGSVSGFVYVTEEDFDSDVYTVAYVHAAGAKETTVYTDEYDELVDRVYDGIDAIADVRCEIRYNEVIEEAQGKLDDAKKEVEDGKQEVADAKQELADAKEEAESELSEAESELTKGESELADGKEELEDAKQEVADGEQELADGEQELAENETTIEDARRQIAEARGTLNSGESEYASGLKEYKSESAKAEKKLKSAEKQIKSGEKQLKDAWKEYNTNLAQLESGEQQLAAAEKQLDEGQQAYDAAYESTVAQLDAGRAAYDTGVDQLASGRAAYEAGAQELAAKQQEYESGRQQLDAAWAQYNGAAGQIEEARTQAAALEGQVAMLQSACGQLESAAGGLKSEIAALQSQAGGLPGEIGALQSQVSEQESAKSAAQAEAQDAQNQLAVLGGSRDAKAAEKAAAEEQYNAAAADLAAKEQDGTATDEDRQNVQNLKSTVDRLAAELQEIDGQIAAQTGRQDNANNTVSACDGQIASLNGQIAAKQSALASANETLPTKQAAYDETVAQLQAQQAQLNGAQGGLAQLQAKLAEYEETGRQLKEQEDLLAAGKQQLDAGQAQLAATKQQLDAAEAQLAATKQQLDAGYAELSAAKQELETGRQEIAAKKAELAAARQQLDAGRKQLEKSESELASSKKEIEKGYKELKQAKKKLTSARKELDDGWAKFNASQSQLSDGERQLSEGRTQLADARKELLDARQQIADAEQEIAENEQKLKDGWADYEEGKKEADEKIADAEQKIKDAEAELLDAEQEINDAQQEIDDIKKPTWYVDDRSVLPDNSGFGENAERMSNIAKVFPVLFFLVAALISLTTMTRMVEEERTQIGTLKALGYSKWSIAGKYLKYAFFATVGGSVFGILVGEKIFPWVIINAYGILYLHLPKIVIPYNWSYGAIASAAALICTIGATLSACYREMLAVPAALMRPPAPKEGKRVWLEYLPFIWKHLSFSWKSTVRNLMRYKKRFLMTIIGIGGCMGLLLVGYGLRDSIMDIGVMQFEELQTFDALVVLDDDAPADKQQEAVDSLENEQQIRSAERFYMQREEVQTNDGPGKTWSVYVYVPERLEGLDEFFTFRDRVTKETFELTDEGAIITEKISKELNIKPGDTVTLEPEDGGEAVEIPVQAVCENYLQHYLYLSPALYEKIYGEEPQYNSVFFTSDESQKAIEEMCGRLLEYDAVLNVTYTRTMAQQIDNMLGALDIVIVVLIISAGMLAFVVLYNLNNININERRRELATLKVLGFYDGEVAMYVYRENVLLTIIGAGLGCLIGKLLHAYVITTVEVDVCMFGRNINLPSFVIGTLFTIGFSVLVNFVMFYKLKKIDMVESLKSVE